MNTAQTNPGGAPPAAAPEDVAPEGAAPEDTAPEDAAPEDASRAFGADAAETTDPVAKVKHWVETHRTQSMLAAFGIGVFLGAWLRR